MDPQTKVLLDFISNVGLPGGFLLLLGIAAIRLVPALVRWWAASADQARSLSAAIPNMERSLEKMANGNETLLELLRQMNVKLDAIHSIVSDRGT